MMRQMMQLMMSHAAGCATPCRLPNGASLTLCQGGRRASEALPESPPVEVLARAQQQQQQQQQQGHPDNEASMPAIEDAILATAPGGAQTEASMTFESSDAMAGPAVKRASVDDAAKKVIAAMSAE